MYMLEYSWTIAVGTESMKANLVNYVSILLVQDSAEVISHMETDLYTKMATAMDCHIGSRGNRNITTDMCLNSPTLN